MNDTNALLALADRMLWVTALVAAPVLLASLAVGLVVGVVQAATSINEQTLTFVPKLAAIALVSSDSAVYGSVLQIAVGVLQTIVFLIPGTNPNASTTPLWSVLVSVALSVGGIAAYKRWESTQGEDVFARMPKVAAGVGVGGAGLARK